MNEKAKQNIEELEILIHYLKIYFPTSQKEYLNQLIEQKNSLKLVIDYSNLKILNKELYLSNALKTKKRERSKLFSIIYELIKNSLNQNEINELNLLENASQKFDSIKDFLENQKLELINENELNFIILKIKTEKELKKEILILKEIFFENKNININEAEQQLIYIHQKENLIKQISNVIKLILKFVPSSETNELIEKLKQYNERLS